MLFRVFTYAKYGLTNSNLFLLGTQDTSVSTA